MKILRYLVPLIAITAFLFVAAPALAGWGFHAGTGSVIGAGTVTGLKNAQKNGANVLVTISAYGATLSNGSFGGPGGMPGVVWCGNPGSNSVVPGVNPVTLMSNFTGTEFVAPSQIDQNGKAPFNVHAKVDATSLNGQILASLSCPGGNVNKNTNWVLVDFTPQQFSALLQGFDSTGALLTQAIYDCQIPWQVLQSLAFQQQSPYTCTERLDQRVH